MANTFAPAVAEFTITARVKLSDGQQVTFTIHDDGASYIDHPYNVDASAARDLQEVVREAVKDHLQRHPLPLPGADWRNRATNHPVDARTFPAGNQQPPPSPAYPTHLGY